MVFFNSSVCTCSYCLSFACIAVTIVQLFKAMLNVTDAAVQADVFRAVIIELEAYVYRVFEKKATIAKGREKVYSCY